MTNTAATHFWTTEGIVDEAFAVKDYRPIHEITEGGIPNTGTVDQMLGLTPYTCPGCNEQAHRALYGSIYCGDCADMIEEWERINGY